MLVPNGSASAPAYSFTNSTNSGMAWDGTSAIIFYRAGNTALTLQQNGQTLFPAGAANGPSITDGSNSSTGLYWPTTTSLGLTVGNVQQQQWTAGVSQVSLGGANSTSYAINSRKSRGTVASPTVITTGDDLLTMSGYGYVGGTNTYQEASKILFDSEGVVTDSASGIMGNIQFWTAASTTEPAERMRIDSSGRIGIASTSPWALLSINATSSSAVPLFAVASTTGTATSTAFIIDSNGKVGIGTTTPGQQLSVAGAGLFSSTVTANCFSINGASCLTAGATVAGSTGELQFNSGGVLAASSNLYWDNTNKRLGINSSSPTAALFVSASSSAQSLTKTSTGDFSVSGSSVSPAYNAAGTGPTIATTSNQIMLQMTASTTIGNGVFTDGPTVVGTVGGPLVSTGANSIQRPDGKSLVIFGFVAGAATSSTGIYDPVANTFSAGPSIVGTTLNNAGQGSYSIQRPDGKFLVILAGGTTDTSIYDPVANTFAKGPALSDVAQGGAHAIQRPDGKFLVILGNSSSATSIYDPVANTNVTGPTVVGTVLNTVSYGGHAIQRPDGKFLVILGNNNSNTSLYDPVANTFVAGPAVVGTVASLVRGGAHSIQRPDGKFLVLLGSGSSDTSIYDPVDNTFKAGPAVVGTGGGSLINFGAHSIQRPDGKFLTFVSNGTATSIYDPITNTFTAGPALSNTLSNGAHSIQRPDGKYLVILGNGTSNTSIYDPGWATTGSYESEPLSLPKLNPSSIIKWNSNGEGIIEVAVKLAGSQAGLGGATYATTTNGALIYHSATTTSTWAQVRVTMTRSIPTNNQPYNRNVNSNVWLGESDTKYYRNFAQPTLYDFTIDNSSVFRKDNADFGSGYATTTTNITGNNATSSGPTLINLLGGDNGLSLPYGFNSASTTATSTLIGNFFASSTPLVGTAASLAQFGSHSIQRPDGKFLVILGAQTTDTSIYDPYASTSAPAFTAGPALTANTRATSHSIQRPDGKFLVILGNNNSNTSIYDPVANTIVAGPSVVGTAANLVNTGSHSIQRPDGKFLVILGNNDSNTSIYDPIANTFTTGPALVGTAANLVNNGAHSIQRPDGKFLVILAGGGGASNTSIYDPVVNTFVAGPALVGTAASLASEGSHSIQRPDGKFLVILGNNTSNTSIYDPVADTFIAGPALGGTAASLAGDGSHSIQRPDGKFLVILGNGTSDTSIYDPIQNVFYAGPKLNGNLAYYGSHSIQRPDGKYLTITGNNLSTTNLYDAGWVTEGSYISETIYNTALDSTSALVWTGNADAFKPGAISFRVKTASSQAGLATTTWRTLPTSGSLINPASGDTWMQVQIQMHRNIPSQPGAEKNVWLGESSVVYNRLPLQAGAGIPSVNQAQVFTKPTITSYRVVNSDNADLASFSLNGQSLFRFSAGGDAFTGGGAWNAGGADVAEYFPTDDFELVPGDIVSVRSSFSQTSTNGLVERSRGEYDEQIIGVVSSAPGLKLGSDITGGNAGKQPIALIGRVPVKVSLEGGMIKKGDRLTSSSKPGIAMKATDAGRVVGIALEDYGTAEADSDVANILVFVSPHEWAGDGGFFARVGRRVTQWKDAVVGTLSGLSVFAEEGKVGIGVAPTAVLTVANGVSSTTPVAVFRAMEGQTADLLRVENASSTPLFRVTSDGNVVVGSPSASLGTSTMPSGLLTLLGSSSTTPVLTIEGVLGQTAPLLVVRGSEVTRSDLVDGERERLNISDVREAQFMIDAFGRVDINVASTTDATLTLSGKNPRLALQDLWTSGVHRNGSEWIMESVAGSLRFATSTNAGQNTSSETGTIPVLVLDTLGRVGIGTSTPTYALSVAGDISARSFVIDGSSDDLLTFGNHTLPVATSSLSAVNLWDIATRMKNVGITTNLWQSGVHDANATTSATTTRYSLDLDTLPPEILTVSATGKKGLDLYQFSLHILAGVQSALLRLDNLEGRVTRLEEWQASSTALALQNSTSTISSSLASTTDSFIAGAISSVSELIGKFSDLFADKITVRNAVAETLTVGSQEKPAGITLYDEVTKEPYCFSIANGAPKATPGVCVSTSNQQSTTTNPQPTDGSTSDVPTDREPPVLIINGNNPAQVVIGASYADLGATVTDNVSPNLGVYAIVNGVDVGAVSNIQIGTASSSTYTIEYYSLDQAGNRGSATRTVVVGTGQTNPLSSEGASTSLETSSSEASQGAVEGQGNVSPISNPDQPTTGSVESVPEVSTPTPTETETPVSAPAPTTATETTPVQPAVDQLIIEEVSPVPTPAPDSIATPTE